jgi:hypothetical protein
MTKSRANLYLKQIARATGANEDAQGVQRFVRAKIGSETSLETMAIKLGVREIVEEHMPFEGGVFDLPNRGLIIKLKSDSPQYRKRFTLAHEIGHLLLGKPGLRSSCGQNSDLETACNSIASELLMPSGEAIAFVQALGKPSPEKLKVIASKYGVSLHMAAKRVHEDFGLWKFFIGCWQRHPKIKTEWFVGYSRRWDRAQPDEHSLDLALSSEGPVQSKELWQRGPQAEPIWLNLLRLGTGGRVLGLIGFVN